jgi:eukaryotic-like serine/threonine-protein kinase
MDPERWKLVSQLFHAALNRPPHARETFLADACSMDSGLRADVEALLAADQEAEGASDPFTIRAARMPMTGRTLGHYHILAKIGSGGMGDVYLAHDLTLNRKVALKILPPELADTESLRARFEREAKAIAALNHPNIVTIHSVEEAEGVHFITMELVKGTTLAELLPRQGFALDRFFDIAVALADAVAAAHAEGIVHRDLKPGNVMVDPDGRVKVLDFGLAKASDRLAESGAASHLLTAQTEQGVIVGTCKYMSPEQARGETVDARSDIFSLGIVFYEMLTGRPPFEGTTPSDVISSIIKDVPPSISEGRSGIPRELSRMVRRCLSKDVSKRVQSALDIRNELSELRRELESGELIGTLQPTRRTRLTLTNVGLPIAAAIGLFLLVRVSRSTKSQQVVVPRVENPVQVTSAAGLENHPTWSPDGGRIAYDSDQSGNPDIWVAQPTGGPAVNLTPDHDGSDREPAWSPDGNQIAFVSERDGRGVYVIPAIGGPSNRMSPRASVDLQAFNSPAWSSDGAELAYLAVYSQATFIEIVTLKTRESRRLEIPGEPGNRYDLSWSPDGRFFAYVRAANDAMDVTRIWVLRAADAQALAITGGMSADWSPKWSKDARTLFFISNIKGSMDLWQQQISKDGGPEGEAEPITVGIGMQRAAFTPDGRKLAYSKGRPVANVWRVPILEDRDALWTDAKQLTFDYARITDLEILPDREHLLVNSDRGGIQNIWSLPIQGNDPRQITSERVPDFAPRLSPDGKQIAFYSYRSGERKIWAMPSDGGPAVRLTTEGVDMYPSWSPDNRHIAFSSSRAGGGHIFVMPATGGEARQVTTGSSWDFFPEWSPDGTRLAFTSNRDDGIHRLWWVPPSGGSPRRLTQGPALFFRWSPDGKRIYFAPPGYPPSSVQLRGWGDVWELTVADGKERQVTRLSGRAGWLGNMAVGEHDLYFTWDIWLGDIWVMDVVTPKNE